MIRFICNALQIIIHISWINWDIRIKMLPVFFLIFRSITFMEGRVLVNLVTFIVFAPRTVKINRPSAEHMSSRWHLPWCQISLNIEVPNGTPAYGSRCRVEPSHTAECQMAPVTWKDFRWKSIGIPLELPLILLAYIKVLINFFEIYNSHRSCP